MCTHAYTHTNTQADAKEKVKLHSFQRIICHSPKTPGQDGFQPQRTENYATINVLIPGEDFCAQGDHRYAFAY